MESTKLLKETVEKEIKEAAESDDLSKGSDMDKKKELSAIEDLIYHRLMQIVMA